jgi:thioesterase domain-containing protein
MKTTTIVLIIACSLAFVSAFPLDHQDGSVILGSSAPLERRDVCEKSQSKACKAAATEEAARIAAEEEARIAAELEEAARIVAEEEARIAAEGEAKTDDMIASGQTTSGGYNPPSGYTVNRIEVKKRQPKKSHYLFFYFSKLSFYSPIIILNHQLWSNWTLNSSVILIRSFLYLGKKIISLNVGI